MGAMFVTNRKDSAILRGCRDKEESDEVESSAEGQKKDLQRVWALLAVLTQGQFGVAMLAYWVVVKRY